MYETEADLIWLQDLLDRSYDVAGEHLRSITTPERRIPADELGEFAAGGAGAERGHGYASGFPGGASPQDSLGDFKQIAQLFLDRAFKLVCNSDSRIDSRNASAP